MKTLVGEIEIRQKQAKKLGLRERTSIGPALQKCCLRVCAMGSYQQGEETLLELMGISVGHSTLHRLVQGADLPPTQAEEPIEGLSVDGGKICLRGEVAQGGQWRDYKLVSLHGSVCEAFFQAPTDLIQWVDEQPLAPILNCLADGHDGVWNLIKAIGKKRVPIKREILDWFHLKENLYKVGGSIKRLQLVENFLWHGWVEPAIAAFEGLKSQQARRFQNYLHKHQHHIPCYARYQRLGIPVGSGDVESKIKQVAARVQLSGARWQRENVPQILRLRCAYLNRSPVLSIYTHS